MANAGTEHPTPEAAAPVPAAGAPAACDHLIYPLCGCAAPPAVADAAPEATPEAAPPAKPPRKPPSRRKSGTSIPWAKDAQEEQARKKREAEQLRERVLAMMQDPKQYPALEKQINAERARRSFAEFFRQSWKEFDPNTDLVWNWHLGLMCCVLQALFFDWLKTKRVKGYINKCRHVIFSVPPGSSKSAVISRAFQAFCWLHFPGMKFICLSVNEEAALRDAVATRDLVSSPWYRGQFGTTFTIKGDQDAKGNFANTVGGSRISRPIKAETVGLRADCVSGDTLVATELGDISIAALHAMPAGTWPRVWSLNHLTGGTELKPVLGTRKQCAIETGYISTHDDRLQCTADHRVWDPEQQEYVQARAAGALSVLRRSDYQGADRQPAAMPHLQVRGTDVCRVSEVFHETGSGIRQAGKEEGERSVLQQAMQDDREQSACDLEGLSALQHAVPSAVNAEVTPVLLEEMLRGTRLQSAPHLGGQDMPAVLDGIHAGVITNGVLRTSLREQGALDSNDVGWQLELLRTSRVEVRRRAVAQPDTADSRAGRECLYGVRRDRDNTLVDSTSHRPRSDEQPAGEPDHALRRLPYGAPQVETATISADNRAFESGRGTTMDVYDIHVDGNHNFFANGILVHNCVSLDDPNNPKKSESKTERDEVNALWDTNHYNRVNNLECSLRIGVQQRTNADDWTGHVLNLQGTWKPEKRNGWLHVVLPAEYDPTRKFVLPPELVELLEEQVRLGNLRQEDLVLADPRTIPGETLDKQRLPPDVLASERERWAGTGNYAGQMQQQPAATEGAIIKRDYWSWFRLEGGVRADIDELITNRPRPDGCTPRDKQAAELVKAKLHAPGSWDFDWVTMSIDPALKKTDRGSNWGLGVFGGKGIRRYWLDDRSQRGDILTILEAIKDMVRLWRPTKILLEDKAASAEVHREIMNAIAAGGMPMVEIVLVKVGNQGKEQRLDTALPTLANGLVALLDGATWLEAVVEETAWFPRGMNDDRVDYMSQLINHYATVDAAGGTWVGF